MIYKVEFTESHFVEIEADTEKEAEDKAAVMEDEEILCRSIENTGMLIWSVDEKR